MTVANADSAVAPVLTAALLLLAAQHARRLNLPVPSGARIFEATGAKRSRAYELSEQLARLLPGLLKSSLPPIVVPLGDLRESARSIAALVVLAYARGLNQRPRHGRTRAELLQHQPSPEQFAQAQAALQERYRKQQLAQQTLAARQNPQVRSYLNDTFQRFQLSDPRRVRPHCHRTLPPIRHRRRRRHLPGQTPRPGPSTG